MLQERAAVRGVKLPGKAASDPKDLGDVLTDLHEKPGQLRDIFGPRRARPQEQASSSNPIRDHAVVPDGHGRARGHRSHGRQAHGGARPDVKAAS